MTSLVGIRCSDGVVIGADSAATFGSAPQDRIIEQPTEKIDIIGDQIIVAGTGAVGLNQRFVSTIKTAYSKNRKDYVSRDPWVIAKDICRSAREDFGSTGVEKGQYGALVALPGNGNRDLCLFEFGTLDLQPEMKDTRLWYCSMGCAEHITDPFLAFMREVFWENGSPTLAEGVFAATWTLEHAIKYNPGGVNGPFRIAVLEVVNQHATARMVGEDELEEHRMNIAGAKQALRDYRQQQRPDAGLPIPSIPKLGNT